MMKYSKQIINNSILRSLSEDMNMGDILDTFLMMKMSNDMDESKSQGKKAPSLSDIKILLLGNEVIEEKDYSIKMFSGVSISVPRLSVKISPSCTLFIESYRGLLQAKVNDKSMATMGIRMNKAEDVAMWIIRQKENFESYLEEWDTAIKTASKNNKGNRMSMHAIKAIFSEAMKEYPNLVYDFMEQKRRLRIWVKLPNSKLGVYIDAWWGSYKKRLPEQIEDLKVLIEAHSKTHIKDFFISHK